MNRMSFIENSAPDFYLFKDCLPSFVKMAAFWAEMGMTYLEINKLPCLHEIDIPKCINV